MLEALIGVIVGGVITALGTFVTGSALNRRGQAQSERDQRLSAARETLGALQELNRRLIDVARVDTNAHDDEPWQELHLATIRWNTARIVGSLLAPADEVAMIKAIDAETDAVMDAALSRKWPSREFRAQREALGQLGARYLNLVRTNEGLPEIDMPSLWVWSESRESLEERLSSRSAPTIESSAMD